MSLLLALDGPPPAAPDLIFPPFDEILDPAGDDLEALFQPPDDALVFFVGEPWEDAFDLGEDFAPTLEPFEPFFPPGVFDELVEGGDFEYDVLLVFEEPPPPPAPDLILFAFEEWTGDFEDASWTDDLTYPFEEPVAEGVAIYIPTYRRRRR